MKIIKLLLLISIINFSNCLNYGEQKSSNNKTKVIQQSDQFIPVIGDCINLNDIKGVLSLNDNYSKPNDTIFLKNNDGSIWHKFSFYYDDSDGKYDFENEKFKPYSFNPDYFNLSLFVVNKNENSYSVIANHETGLIKEIDNDNKALKFQTLEEYFIKNIYSINFDNKNNPIRKSYNSGEIISLSENKEFYPVEIKVHWMKIKWKSDQGWQEGWIEWRDDKCLLIDVFYYA